MSVPALAAPPGFTFDPKAVFAPQPLPKAVNGYRYVNGAPGLAQW